MIPEFIQAAQTQITTVWATAKTAAIVIFLSGLVAGCVVF